ncbi:MAG: zinc ribbon domain-containing protein [Fidelibacterota bacterium]
MPIYEYKCQSCGKAFSALVRSSTVSDSEVKCKFCEANDVKRLLTTKVAFGSSTTSSRPADCCAPAGSSFG